MAETVGHDNCYAALKMTISPFYFQSPLRNRFDETIFVVMTFEVFYQPCFHFLQEWGRTTLVVDSYENKQRKPLDVGFSELIFSSL